MFTDLTSAQPMSNGWAIVENVFEQVSATWPSASMFPFGNTTVPVVTNIMVWNNTFLGGKVNMAYDWATPTMPGLVWRIGYSLKNNIIQDFYMKSDNFTPFDGTCIGNWSAVNGVGFSGNFYGFDSAYLEYGENKGIGAIFYTTNIVKGAYNFSSFAANYQYPTYAAGAGGGDYHPTVNSPFRTIATDLLIPYDLDGVARYSGGAAGAYEYPAPSSPAARARTPVVNPPRKMKWMRR
jgi:hypothetical protein